MTANDQSVSGKVLSDRRDDGKVDMQIKIFTTSINAADFILRSLAARTALWARAASQRLGFAAA